MSSSAPASAPDPRQERLSFFRQGGWMLLANAIAGLCFTLVHTPAGRIASVSKSEYATFGALLDALPLLILPAGGLQAVFAQLAASAVDEPRRARLRATVRRVLSVFAAGWLAAILGIWVGQRQVLELFHIADPWALGLTLGVAFVGMLFPVFAGLLQGTQNFLWLGTASILSGAGRLLGVTLTVVALGGLAAGAMGGVLLGSSCALALAVWVSRSVWMGPAATVRDWSWLGSWLVLTLGTAAGSIMLSADTQLVQSAFSDDEKAFYVAAGRVGRGLVYLTMPLALVLFPRVARSAATGQPTGALKLALGATLGTGVAAALACTLFPELPIRCLYIGNPVFLPAAELVPLFCWSMLPLAAAYTLVNNLLARKRFVAVPWLLAVAVGYSFTLTSMREGIVQRGSFLLHPDDLRPALAERLARPKTPWEVRLAGQIPTELRNRLVLTNLSATDWHAIRPALSLALNACLQGSTLLETGELAALTSAPRPATLAQWDQPEGKRDLPRLNRLLLEDAWPDAVVRKPERRLFDEFRRVLYALGGFSLLLLGVSVLFSLPRAGDAPVAPRA